MGSSVEAKKFEETRRYAKSYLIKWNEVGFNGQVVLTPREATITAHSFLDALGKTERLHKCNSKDLLEISFLGVIQIMGGSDDTK